MTLGSFKLFFLDFRLAVFLWAVQPSMKAFHCHTHTHTHHCFNHATSTGGFVTHRANWTRRGSPPRLPLVLELLDEKSLRSDAAAVLSAVVALPATREQCSDWDEVGGVLVGEVGRPKLNSNQFVEAGDHRQGELVVKVLSKRTGFETTKASKLS